jgi:transposase
MVNHPAPALTLRDGDRAVLESWIRSASVRASAAKRARIVLLAADGESNQRIVELVDASRITVIAWRDRYLDRGLDGLSDRERPGRPRELDQDAIIVATLTPPPTSLGVTHWSTRVLAVRLKISPASVARAWRAYGIKPFTAELFRFSTDPELVGKGHRHLRALPAPAGAGDRAVRR